MVPSVNRSVVQAMQRSYASQLLPNFGFEHSSTTPSAGMILRTIHAIGGNSIDWSSFALKEPTLQAG